MLYKSHISLDGENFFWVIIKKENCNSVNATINKNPTQKDLNDIYKSIKYNKTNICTKCTEEGTITDKSILYPRNVYKTKNGQYVCGRCYDNIRRWGSTNELTIKKAKFPFYGELCPECKSVKLLPGEKEREYPSNKYTGRWLCKSCWNKNYQKNNPDSFNNTIKSLANRRTGNTNPYSHITLGDKFEELTSRWLEVDILSKKNDHFELPYDHSPHPTLGIIQTKGKVYDPLHGTSGSWKFANNDYFKKFDNQISYCASADILIIEEVYKIPGHELMNKRESGYTIYKNPINNHGDPIIPWYEKYRVKDPEILKKVNAIWKQILKEYK